MEDHKLREIEEQYHDPQRRKSEMLSRWLRKGHNCTWRRVVEVLMQMGEMVVADTIKLKYLTLTTGRWRYCRYKYVSRQSVPQNSY